MRTPWWAVPLFVTGLVCAEPVSSSPDPTPSPADWLGYRLVEARADAALTRLARRYTELLIRAGDDPERAPGIAMQYVNVHSGDPTLLADIVRWLEAQPPKKPYVKLQEEMDTKWQARGQRARKRSEYVLALPQLDQALAERKVAPAAAAGARELFSALADTEWDSWQAMGVVGEAVSSRPGDRTKLDEAIRVVRAHVAKGGTQEALGEELNRVFRSR